MLRDSDGRRRAYAPASNTARHDNHEKINSWLSFSFLYEYGAPLGGPSGRRSSPINMKKFACMHKLFVIILRDIIGLENVLSSFNQS